ncbi:unnamed protein product [Triticum turgidum subsp. durum]|uniref:DUF7378 domain-containing protein n=2 Tax=Triticum TaxID=4564 RepID=A0A9R0RD96_TRITD|nr:unnamed protein product [Triticum turgidum subsp. durum]
MYIQYFYMSELCFFFQDTLQHTLKSCPVPNQERRHLLPGIMAPSASTGQKVNLKGYKTLPHAIQLVTMMSGTSSASTLTIGDQNKKFKVSRALTWMVVICIPATFIAITAGSAYRMYNKPIWAAGFPSRLPVVLMLGAYLAVVNLALGYLTLYLPQAPFAVWKALDDVGLRLIGLAVILISGPVLLSAQAWLHIIWACLLGVLIAAILAFCVCLARTYSK